MGSVSTGSQVSVLYRNGGNKLSHHWFTATPNPDCSIFKPFVFTPGVSASESTVTATRENLPHSLYTAHAHIRPLPGSDVNAQMRDAQRALEEKYIEHVEQLCEGGDRRDQRCEDDVKHLFDRCVAEEMSLYAGVS